MMSTLEATQPTEQMAKSHSDAEHAQLQPVPDLADYVKAYARQKPEVAALWCFGIGFVLGWKLKPW